MTYDCQTCGACCCNSDQNKAEEFIDYVEVLPRDALAKQPPRVLRRLTVVNGQGERHLRLVGEEQRCIALKGELGQLVTCSIYELRPKPCRILEAGSSECRARRRERGISGGSRRR